MTITAEGAFQALAGALAADLDAVIEDYLVRVRAEAPEWFDLPDEVKRTGEAIARESIRIELEYLLDGARLPEECPAVDRTFAEMVADLEGAPDEIRRAYSRGHAAQWSRWLELVEAADLPGDVRADALRDGTRFFFAYADRLAKWTFEIYTRRRDALLASAEQRRVNLVRDVLAGADPDAAGLGYDLDGWHVGAVGFDEASAAALRGLGDRLGRRTLVVKAGERTWWAWLGGGEPLGRVAPPAGAGIAFGREARGPAGFRTTHEQALRAHRAGAASFDDVALEALAGADAEAAAAFVRAELCGLEADDERSGALRETLRAYFATGHNAAAAGARLGVHEQTVAARLRTVEARIGHPVIARRAELEVALRLDADIKRV